MITGRKLFELLAAHAAGGAYLDNSDEMDHAGVCIDGWFNLDAVAEELRRVSVEPTHISQCCEPKTPQERDAWWAAQGAAAKAAGVVFHRYSSHPDDPDLILYEGWMVRPPEDLGEPRWQLTAGEEKQA
jgi:hypothetical protein